MTDPSGIGGHSSVVAFGDEFGQYTHHGQTQSEHDKSVARSSERSLVDLHRDGVCGAAGCDCLVEYYRS